MKLMTYLKPLSPKERADFALEVGTTIAHINNVKYGLRTASAALTRGIAIRTGRQVAEWDLRPDDWHLIWPELVGTPGAPAVDLLDRSARREVPAAPQAARNAA